MRCLGRAAGLCFQRCAEQLTLGVATPRFGVARRPVVALRATGAASRGRERRPFGPWRSSRLRKPI